MRFRYHWPAAWQHLPPVGCGLRPPRRPGTTSPYARQMTNNAFFFPGLLCIGASMQYRHFGKSGFQCSEIGFGAWAIGSHWGVQKDTDSIAALHRALDLGCNFIDTAAGYGDGRSERLIGEVLRARAAAGKTDRIFVATKTPPANGMWPPSPYDAAEDRYSEKHLRANLEQRLANLG